MKRSGVKDCRSSMVHLRSKPSRRKTSPSLAAKKGWSSVWMALTSKLSGCRALRFSEYSDTTAPSHCLSLVWMKTVGFTGGHPVGTVVGEAFAYQIVMMAARSSPLWPCDQSGFVQFETK